MPHCPRSFLNESPAPIVQQSAMSDMAPSTPLPWQSVDEKQLNSIEIINRNQPASKYTMLVVYSCNYSGLSDHESIIIVHLYVPLTL